jgi:hypothetical protein
MFASVVRIAIIAGLVGCSPGASDAEPAVPQLHLQNEAEFVTIVADYVRHTRGWADDGYTVRFNRRDSKMLVFWVLYNGNPPRQAGGGESFEAHLNPDTKRIEKELHFQ